MKAMRRMNDAQRIAKKLVIEHYKLSPKDESYKSLIKGLGSMIIQNGIYGTLVFLLAKSKNGVHYTDVANDLEDFLIEIGIYDGKNDILTFLEETSDLPIIQDEILEFVNWYRRYVEIYI